jgi:hypothetical protein
LRLKYEEIVTNNTLGQLWDMWNSYNKKKDIINENCKFSKAQKPIYMIEEQIYLLDAYLVVLNYSNKAKDIDTLNKILKDIVETKFLGYCNTNYDTSLKNLTDKINELAKIHAFRCLLIILKFMRIDSVDSNEFDRFPYLLFSEGNSGEKIIKTISSTIETNNYSLAVFSVIKGIYKYLNKKDTLPDQVKSSLDSSKATINIFDDKVNANKVIYLLSESFQNLVPDAIEDIVDIYYPICFHCLNVILYDKNIGYEVNSISYLISLLLNSNINKATFLSGNNNVFELFQILLENYLISQDDQYVEQICFSVLDSRTSTFHQSIYNILSNLGNIKVPIKRANLLIDRSGQYIITNSIDNLKIAIPNDIQCEPGDEIDQNYQYVYITGLSFFNNIKNNWTRLLNDISTRSFQFYFLNIVRIFLQIMQDELVLYDYLEQYVYNNLTELVQYLFETLYVVYKFRSNQAVLELLANDAFDLLLKIQKAYSYRKNENYDESVNFCNILASNIEFESKQGYKRDTISILDCFRLIFNSQTSYGNIARALQFIQKMLKFISLHCLFTYGTNKGFVLEIYKIFASYLDRIKNIKAFFVLKDVEYLNLKSEILFYSVKIIHTILTYINFQIDKCQLRMVNSDNNYLLFIQSCLETYNFNDFLFSILYPELESKISKDKITSYIGEVIRSIPENINTTANILKTIKYTFRCLNAIFDIVMFMRKWESLQIFYINLGYLYHWYDSIFGEGEFPYYEIREKDIKVDLRLNILTYISQKRVEESCGKELVFASLKVPELYGTSIACLALQCIGKILLLFNMRISTDGKRIPSLSSYLNIVRVKFVKDTNQHNNILSEILDLLTTGGENTNAALELLTICIKTNQIDFLYPLIQYNTENNRNKNSFWHVLEYMVNNEAFFNKRNKFYFIIFLSALAMNETTSKYFNQELSNNQKTVINLKALIDQINVIRYLSSEVSIDQVNIQLKAIDLQFLDNLVNKALALLFTRLILISTPTNKFIFKQQLEEFITRRVNLALESYENNVDDEIIYRLCNDYSDISETSQSRYSNFAIENYNKTIDDRDDYYLKVFKTSSGYNYGINYWLDKRELYLWGGITREDIDEDITRFNLNLSLFDSKTLAMFSIGYLFRIIFNIGIDNTIGSRVFIFTYLEFLYSW